MGTAYKKNLKNLHGKPDVTARDVISLGASSISTGSDVGLGDAQSITSQPAVRAARLDGASIVLSSGLSAGDTVSCALSVDGAVAASGDMGSGDTYLDLILDKEDLETVDVDAGGVVTLVYTATLVGGAPNISARVYLSLLE